jgi:hypothetical protein
MCLLLDGFAILLIWMVVISFMFGGTCHLGLERRHLLRVLILRLLIFLVCNFCITWSLLNMYASNLNSFVSCVRACVFYVYFLSF